MISSDALFAVETHSLAASALLFEGFNSFIASTGCAYQIDRAGKRSSSRSCDDCRPRVKELVQGRCPGN